jgi:hypothetical protein
MEGALEGFDFFLGALAAVLIGNGLTIAFVYALIWGEAQNKRGVDESKFPLWWFVGASAGPLIGAVACYATFY